MVEVSGRSSVSKKSFDIKIGKYWIVKSQLKSDNYSEVLGFKVLSFEFLRSKISR